MPRLRNAATASRRSIQTRWWAVPENRLPRVAAAAKLLQSCPTLCDPIDSSLPGSAVPGIL